MKKLALLFLASVALSGCATYTSVTKLGKGKVAVVKNDHLLGGIITGPQVFICNAGANGLSHCQTNQNP